MAKFKAIGYDPEGYTLNTYAAIQVYAAAAKATGGTDSKKIAEWIRASHTVPTVIGNITMDSKGDIKDPKLSWYVFHDGKYAEDLTIQ